MRTARLGAIAISPLVLGVGSVAVGAATPGYRPLADTVSQLGSPGAPHSGIISAVFLCYGALVMIGAGVLGDVAEAASRWVGAAVALYATAGVVTGLAPKDPPGTHHTFVSEVHVAATVVGGGAILSAMCLVGVWGRSRSTRRTAFVVGASTAVLALIFPFAWGSSVYGLIERLLLALAGCWLAGLALLLLWTDAQSPAGPG